MNLIIIVVHSQKVCELITTKNVDKGRECDGDEGNGRERKKKKNRKREKKESHKGRERK